MLLSPGNSTFNWHAIIWRKCCSLAIQLSGDCNCCGLNCEYKSLSPPLLVSIRSLHDCNWNFQRLQRRVKQCIFDEFIYCPSSLDSSSFFLSFCSSLIFCKVMRIYCWWISTVFWTMINLSMQSDFSNFYKMMSINHVR